jgi:thioesterase domain-containing protein
MPDNIETSEARRALLEKYLRGERPQSTKASALPQRALDSPASLEKEQTNLRTPVTALQIGTSRRPFFFLHGHFEGDAFYCFALAHALEPDQPFYALEPYKLDDLQVAPPIETIAAAHIASIRATQPEGPYLLGGYCNGALVAYEMARQLHAQGQETGLLVLMDPVPLFNTYPAYYRLLRGIIARCGGSVGLGPDKQLDWFIRIRYLLRETYNSLRNLHRMKLNGAARPESGEQIEPGHRRDKATFAIPWLKSMILTDEAIHQDYVGIFEWLAMDYRPSSIYPGKITFFWPGEKPSHVRWWRAVSERTEVEAHIIPGTQVSWKTEHLPALSECLRKCLHTVQATLD